MATSSKPIINNGSYLIWFRNPEQLLTIIGDEEGDFATIQSPTGISGQQEWTVRNHDDNTITIQHLRSGLYLSYRGEADPHKFTEVIGLKEPRKWALDRFEDERFTAFVVVPDDTDLALTEHVIRIFPPRTAVLQRKFAHPWTFQFLE